MKLWIKQIWASATFQLELPYLSHFLFFLNSPPHLAPPATGPPSVPQIHHVLSSVSPVMILHFKNQLPPISHLLTTRFLVQLSTQKLFLHRGSPLTAPNLNQYLVSHPHLSLFIVLSWWCSVVFISVMPISPTIEKELNESRGPISLVH